MNQRERNALDRHITGNWGEGSVPDDDDILDARDMAEEIAEARNGQPSTYLTAEQARSINVYMNPEIVFKLIEMKAQEGGAEVYITYTRLAPETLALLGVGGYRVRRGGVNNDQAVISWADGE